MPRKAPRIASAFCRTPRHGYRRPRRENRGPACGQGPREGRGGFVFAEAGPVGRARAYGREIRAKSAGSDFRQQEKFAGAADLRAGNSLRGRANRPTARRTLWLARGPRESEQRAVDGGRRSGPEGGRKHSGVFLGSGQPAIGEKAGKSRRATHGRAASGQKRQAGGEVVRVHGRAGESLAGGSRRTGEAARRKGFRLGEQE